jgi:hypothetical protein
MSLPASVTMYKRKFDMRKILNKSESGKAVKMINNGGEVKTVAAYFNCSVKLIETYVKAYNGQAGTKKQDDLDRLAKVAEEKAAKEEAEADAAKKEAEEAQAKAAKNKEK